MADRRPLILRTDTNPKQLQEMPPDDQLPVDMLARALGVPLTNLAPGSTAAIAATDTILQAFAKLQAQLASAELPVACSDETTALTTGVKVTFRTRARTLTKLKASLTKAQTSGSALTVGVTIDGASAGTLAFTNGNKLVSITPTITSAAEDAEVVISVTQVGASGAAGLKVYFS